MKGSIHSHPLLLGSALTSAPFEDYGECEVASWNYLGLGVRLLPTDRLLRSFGTLLDIAVLW